MFLAGSPLQVLDSLVVSSEQFHDESGMVFIRTIFCSRLPLMHHSGVVSSLNDSLTGRVAMATVPVREEWKCYKNGLEISEAMNIGILGINKIVPAFRRTCHNFKIVCVHVKKKSEGCLIFHMNASQWKMLATVDQLSNKSDVMKK